jgi:ATP-dependent DNA ligase
MRPKSRQVSNGVATKLIKSTASKEEQQDIGITLWDCVAYKDFQAGLSKIPYQVRLNQLKIPFTYQPDKFNHIFLVENKVCRNEEEILTTAEKLIAQGEEGVIVKDITGIWENKRSKFALKIKDENEADLLVTDVIEGTGKYKGQIGSLICQSSDGNVKVSVGSGLTDDDRKKQPSEFIGRIIAVKYNMIINNASKNGKTLFLPRFVEIREDKDIADTL